MKCNKTGEKVHYKKGHCKRMRVTHEDDFVHQNRLNELNRAELTAITTEINSECLMISYDSDDILYLSTGVLDSVLKV